MRSSFSRAVIAAAFVLACEGQAHLPRELLGRWVCDDPRYEGRSLTLSRRTLVFGGGGTAAEMFEVRDVEPLASADGATTYAVTYGSAGEDDLQLRLKLAAGDPATLKLGERPETWKLAPNAWSAR